jgi:phosphotransferase system HPr-like phosphotransfer protein
MITVTVLLDSVEKVQRFVTAVSKYQCGFDIESGHSCVDAKSLVGLFSLDISKPLHLTINDDGTQIEDILRDLEEYMEY